MSDMYLSQGVVYFGKHIPEQNCRLYVRVLYIGYPYKTGGHLLRCSKSVVIDRTYFLNFY